MKQAKGQGSKIIATLKQAEAGVPGVIDFVRTQTTDQQSVAAECI